MPKQSDFDFANEVLRLGSAPKERVSECLELLVSLEDAGVADALDGIMVIKGYLKEAQVSEVWKSAFARDPFDEEGMVFGPGARSADPQPLPELQPAVQQPPRAPVVPQEPPPAPPPAAVPAQSAGPEPAIQPSSAAPKPPAKLPEIPGFLLETKLEKDSTGINFLGVKAGAARKSVIHILYPQMGGEQKFMAWLIKHGRKLAKLEHPQAARFHALQPLENRAFFGQEIPEGEPLAAILEEGPLAEERALLLLEQFAEVLLHAEEKGVFHGRLTPANIFVHDNDLVHVRFFTFIEEENRLFVEDMPPEAVPFVSPEVKAGSEPTARSDLYSVGRILLRITGADGPDPRKLSQSCLRIAGKMIAQDSQSRYPSASWLLADLELYFEGKEIPEALTKPDQPPVQAQESVPEEVKPPADRKPSGRAQPAAAEPPPKAKLILKAKPVVKPEPEPEPEPEEEVEDAEDVDEEDEEESGGKPRSSRLAGRPSHKGRPSGRRDERPSRGIPVRKGPDKQSGKTRFLKRDAIVEPPPERRKSRGIDRPRVGKPDQDRDDRADDDDQAEKPVAQQVRAKPAEPPREDPRVEGALELAARREEKGDFTGALEALTKALESAKNPGPVNERIQDVRKKGFDEVRRAAREKEKEGDYRGAIKAFEEGRALAPNASDVDEVVKLLEERLEEESRKGEIGKLEAKAKARMEKGDVLGAVAALEEAKAISPTPLLVQAKIDATRKKALDDRMKECQDKESAGDVDAAIAAARRARDFTDNKDEVDAVVRTLTRKKESADKHADYRRCEEDAHKKLAEGDVDAAIECFERSRRYASSALTVDARIEEIKHTAFARFRDQARSAEDSGRFNDAVMSWEQARPYANDPEEIEAAIRLLRSRMQSDEQEKQMQRLRDEAGQLESSGQIEEAIRKLMEFESAAKGPSYTTRLKMTELKKSVFETAIAKSEELKAAGDIDAAIAEIERVREHAPDAKAVDLMISSLKREKTRSKRDLDFRKLQAAAKAKAMKGDILGALDMMEKSKTFADSPVAVDAKISGLKKATFDRLMGEAKSREIAGAWSEAVETYRKARPFADDPVKVDAIVAAIENEITRLRSETEFKRIIAEGEELAAAGKVREAVERMEEAKKVAQDPKAVQARIDQLLIESMYARCLDLSEKKEKAGDLAGAIEACVKAKEYARDTTRIDERLVSLYAMMKGEQPPPSPVSPPAAATAPSPAAAPAPVKPAQIAPQAQTPAPKRPKRETTIFEAVSTPEEDSAEKASGVKSDKISVVCPNPSCRKEFKVPAKYEGRKGKCPSCGKSVEVPASGEKVVCFLCDKVLPRSKANQRGQEFYCQECNDFIAGS